MNRTQKIFSFFFISSILLWLAFIVLIVESALLIFASAALPSILYTLTGGVLVFAVLSTWAAQQIKDRQPIIGKKTYAPIRETPPWEEFRNTTPFDNLELKNNTDPFSVDALQDFAESGPRFPDPFTVEDTTPKKRKKKTVLEYY